MRPHAARVRPAPPRRAVFAVLLAALAAVLLPHDSRAISHRDLLQFDGNYYTKGYAGQSVAGVGDVNGDGWPDFVVGAPGSLGSSTDQGAAYLFLGGPKASGYGYYSMYGTAAADSFGYVVAAAGDVNRDGYADWLVTAPHAYVSGTPRGRVYVYFGGPTVDLTPDWILDGPVASTSFGFSAACVGDQNGDGYDDLLVGMPDGAGGYAGNARLYAGGAPPSSTGIAVFAGEATGDRFGYSVASAGDVNGDGIPDILIGAPRNDGGGADAGRAYVFYGGTTPDISADVYLTGAAASECFGTTVIGAGDMNADGYDDVAVDAPFGGSGRVTVYLGAPAMDATADVTITTTAAIQSFGLALGAGSDLNGDGYADLLVGSPNVTLGSANYVGAVYAYFGGSSVDATADLTIVGTHSYELGKAVAGLGDIDGDGYGDLLTGGPGWSASATNSGGARVVSVYPYQLLSPNGGGQWVAGHTATVHWRGHDMADLALSYDGGFTWTTLATAVGGEEENRFSLVAPARMTSSARVRLTYTGYAAKRSNSDASDSVFSIVEDVPPTPGALRLERTMNGLTGDDLGRVVAPAGDVNGDGWPDLIVGAPLSDQAGTDAGRAYLYFGGPNADAAPDLVLNGAAVGDGFGFAVAGVGDVNGDGYDDFVVGAYLSSGSYLHAGRAYLYFGGRNPDATADLVMSGATAGDFFGCSVAPAGDVNGDGWPDFVVGAMYYDAGPADAGIAYLFCGGPLMDANPDNQIYTSQSAGNMGWSVAGAGDLNGDGYADFVAGGDNSLGARGDVAIKFGRAASYTGADLVIHGAAAGDHFGYHVAGVGDVNGDGFDDLAVSATGADGTVADAGRVYVYFGGADFDTVADLVLTGTGAGDNFGQGLAGAGDVNGDGYADIVVGAPFADLGAANAGRVEVFLGGPWPDAEPDFVLDGLAADDDFGMSVAGAGDLDGNGFGDLVLGAPYRDVGGASTGQVSVVSGNRYVVVSPNGGETWTPGGPAQVAWRGAEPADVWLDADGGGTWTLLASAVGGATENAVGVTVPMVSGTAARVRITPHDTAVTGRDESDRVFRVGRPADPPPVAPRLAKFFPGAAASDWSGYSVAAAGDFNGDGCPDFVVGSPYNDTPGNNAGRAYILYGGPNADAIADVTLSGAAANDYFGSVVASAGDVNGDGYGDVIVGAPANDAAATDAGRAYIYYGGAAPDATPDVILTGTAANENFGCSVASAGDVNGDGFGDVIVGGIYNNAGGSSAGRAYVFLGGPAMDATADVLVTGTAVGEMTGWVVAGAGDVNGDGYDDVLVAAPGNDLAGTDAGRVYLCYGGAVPDGVPDLAYTGEIAGDTFGMPCAGAGDVNGDGFDDVLVGAQPNDGAATNAGRAYLFLGGRLPDATPDLVLSGAAANDYFGKSVAGTGDLNGDGFGDFAVGAYLNDAGGTNSGRVYVYWGGPALDAQPSLLLTGAAGDLFGASVAGIGDWDRDGAPDLAIGAYENGGAGVTAGRTYVWSLPRYVLTSPNGGETWNVGATASVRWQGAQPADVELSVDGGATWQALVTGAGGAASNVATLRVPHLPTRFARVRVVPHDRGVSGSDASDSLFTVQTSVSLLAFTAAPAPGGGAALAWNTDPGVGPEGLAGWRVFRLGGTDPAGVRVGAELLAEPHVTDPDATPGSTWRLVAVNGLQEELELGRVSLASPVTALRVSPSPVRAGQPMRVVFPAPLGAAGLPVSDLDVGLFDVLGRRVATLARGQRRADAAGALALEWTGAPAPGLYFVRVVSPSAGVEWQRRVVVVP